MACAFTAARPPAGEERKGQGTPAQGPSGGRAHMARRTAAQCLTLSHRLTLLCLVWVQGSGGPAARFCSRCEQKRRRLGGVAVSHQAHNATAAGTLAGGTGRRVHGRQRALNAQLAQGTSQLCIGRRHQQAGWAPAAAIGHAGGLLASAESGCIPLAGIPSRLTLAGRSSQGRPGRCQRPRLPGSVVSAARAPKPVAARAPSSELGVSVWRARQQACPDFLGRALGMLPYGFCEYKYTSSMTANSTPASATQQRRSHIYGER